MSRTKRLEHRPARYAATALASTLLACLDATALARASEPALSITIHANHYVFAGHAIDDIDALEGTVGPMRPEIVRLEACGSTAERAQRAAAHRFRTSNLELRWLSPNTARCRAGASLLSVPTASGHDPRPYGIDDAAVDSWWHDLMP